MARNLGYLLGFSVIHLPVTFEMMLLKDKLRHMKNVEFISAKIDSIWAMPNQKYLGNIKPEAFNGKE